MAAPPALARACAICDQSIDNDAKQCPNCGAGEDWLELAEGYAFVQRRFQDWHDTGRITTVQWGRLQEHYRKGSEYMHSAVRQGQPVLTGAGLPPGNQCWSCREYTEPGESRCPECGIILQSPGVRSLRYWKLLQREVQQHQDAGRLSLVQAHEFDAEVRERMAALRGRLEQDRVRPSERLPKSSRLRKSDRVAVPRRSLLEILLDPQSTQWLLASGGALLVLGLIIWLTSLGLFKDPEVIAVAMGLGNAALLAGGFALIKLTRYQVAGRALTLLACLIMPLNLWFYHANLLVTLQGNLWVAGLICCVIYAAAATVLRDELFVYVLCAGLALTGLLLLGNLGRFDEILAPSALLVIMGLIALHLERVFPEIDSPFSRRRFGMAFFWSAQALLGSGLLLLLGAQLFGWLPLWREMGWQRPPAVVWPENLGWTVLLTLAGTYAFVWSDLVVRRIGVYLYFAAIALLWSEVQLLALLDLSDSEPIVLMSLALTALVVNVLHGTVGEDLTYTRAVPPLGLALSLVPVAHGVLLHFRATSPILRQAWPFSIDTFYIAAMVVTALSCRAGAYLYRRSMPSISLVYFFATAAATLMTAAGLAWIINLKPGDDYVPWAKQAPWVMLVPLAYMIAARLYRGHSPEQPLIWVAHASTVLMLVCSLFGALQHTPEMIRAIEGQPANLLYALFCAEAALFYGLAASFNKEGWNVYLATLLFCGAIWQLLIFWKTPHEYYTVIFAVTGIVLLIVYRLSMLENTAWSGLATAAFQSANGLLSLGFLSGALVTLSRLAMSQAELDQLAGGADLWRQPIQMLIFILILLGLLGLVACLLVQHSGWRRFYLVLAISNALLVVACFHKMSLLSPWEKLEIFSIVIGVGLLVIGHIGWYRESERENDLVSFCLLVGGLLATMALIIAVIVHRFNIGQLSALNEFGLVLVGIGLLGTGIVCRLKTTTLIGGMALGVYILIAIIGLHKRLDQSVIVGIYLTAGGGLLFATGLVLSVYRDRLMQLPEKIKRREGIFKVLSWR